MKSQIVQFFLVGIILFFFGSCQQQTSKPSSSGKSGEIVIVIDSTLWNGQAGTILRDSLMASFPGLPQYEPSFTIVNIHPSNFKSILQRHRNVLMVEIGPVQAGKSYSFTFKREVYADPQLVLNLRAVNVSTLDSVLDSMTGTIIQKFTDEERARSVASLRKIANTKVTSELTQLTGIVLPLSDDFFIASRNANYVWVRKETVNTSVGLQIFRMPYSSQTDFAPESIVSVRDSISRVHIPGPRKGSFMTTDKMVPLLLETTQVDSSYAVQLKGLWRTEGDFMGGPFMMYVIHDKLKEELVFIDAFVYAPKFNKREYMKELDARIHSLRFVNSR